MVILILSLLFLGVTIVTSNSSGGSNSNVGYPQGQQVYGGGCGR